MTRLMLLIAFVIVVTMIGGVLGGFVGFEVGRHSPSFVIALAEGKPGSLPGSFRPDEFGLGLGIVSGLFFGAGSSLILVVVQTIREAWQVRKAVQR